MHLLRLSLIACIAVITLITGVEIDCSATEQQEYIALPVTEVADKVDQWMTAGGYTVQQEKFDSGRIHLSAVTGDGAAKLLFTVRLTPQSPLGTALRIEQLQAISPASASELLADLLQIFKNYDNEVPANQTANIIPKPVLDQIENVACIHVQTNAKTVQFTGFFIDEEGLILSTAHDLVEHEHVQILSNTGIPYEGDIIKADFSRDLALIKVNAAKEEVVNVADGRNLLGMGENVFLIGCPINLRGTISQGYLNGPPRKVNNIPLWQVQLKVQQGSSGSPVFDSSGALVAIVKGRHRQAEEIGFLIPLEVVIDFLKEYFSP